MATRVLVLYKPTEKFLRKISPYQFMKQGEQRYFQILIRSIKSIIIIILREHRTGLDTLESGMVTQTLTNLKIADGKRNFNHNHYFDLSAVLKNMTSVACNSRIPHDK
jgi:hypothetical protein